MITCNFLQSLKKFAKGVQSHIKFSKFNVALNPLRQFFLTLQKVASYHADHNSIINNGVTALVLEL